VFFVVSQADAGLHDLEPFPAAVVVLDECVVRGAREVGGVGSDVPDALWWVRVPSLSFDEAASMSEYVKALDGHRRESFALRHTKQGRKYPLIWIKSFRNPTRIYITSKE
jgi:hypothetical protein